MHMHGYHGKIIGSDQRGWSWSNKPGQLRTVGERRVDGILQSLDVTDIVKTWTTGHLDPNHGLGIEPVSNDFYYRYTSRENWNQPPKLVIFCSASNWTPTPTRTPSNTPAVTPTPSATTQIDFTVGVTPAAVTLDLAPLAGPIQWRGPRRSMYRM